MYKHIVMQLSTKISRKMCGGLIVGYTYIHNMHGIVCNRNENDSAERRQQQRPSASYQSAFICRKCEMERTDVHMMPAAPIQLFNIGLGLADRQTMTMMRCNGATGNVQSHQAQMQKGGKNVTGPYRAACIDNCIWLIFWVLQYIYIEKYFIGN